MKQPYLVFQTIVKMFSKKKKLITAEQLGKELSEFMMNEVSYFLESGPGREIIKSFNLDYNSVAEELFFLGQFAVWSVAREPFDFGANDVMGAFEDAFYKELKKRGFLDDELEELESYFRQRTLGLMVMESTLSKEKFAEEKVAEEIGKMSAPVVSEKDPPPDGLSSTISIYYLGIRERINKFLKGYQLEGVTKNIFDEVISRLAVRIFKASTTCAEQIGSRYELDSTKYRKVTLEFLFLFMHLTDRLVSAFFFKEKEKGEIFLDTMYNCILDISVDGAQYLNPKFETTEKIAENVTLAGFNTEEFNKRQMQYYNYKEFLAEPVFNEFAKMICSIIRSETQDPSCVFYTAGIAMESFVKLHIEDELKEILKND